MFSLMEHLCIARLTILPGIKRVIFVVEFINQTVRMGRARKFRSDEILKLGRKGSLVGRGAVRVLTFAGGGLCYTEAESKIESLTFFGASLGSFPEDGPLSAFPNLDFKLKSPQACQSLSNPSGPPKEMQFPWTAGPS